MHPYLESVADLVKTEFKKRDAKIADLRAKLDEATGWADRIHNLWNKVEDTNRRYVEEIADLQAKLIESQREKEARFDCHAGPGTTRSACGACVTCLLREVETLQAKLGAAEREMQALVLFTHNYRTTVASAHEDVRALAGVLRCKKTWHLCGTDTPYKGSSCECDSCKVWYRPTVQAIVEQT